jgi:hypothetical protein
LPAVLKASKRSASVVAPPAQQRGQLVQGLAPLGGTDPQSLGLNASPD